MMEEKIIAIMAEKIQTVAMKNLNIVMIILRRKVMRVKMKQFLKSPVVLSSSSYYGRLCIKYQTVVLWFS